MMGEVNSYQLSKHDAERIKGALLAACAGGGVAASRPPHTLAGELIEAFRRVDKATAPANLSPAYFVQHPDGSFTPASYVTADGSPCPTRVI